MFEDDPIADGTVAMSAPGGTTEASVGTSRYVADSAGRVMVRPADVGALEAVGFRIKGSGQ